MAFGLSGEDFFRSIRIFITAPGAGLVWTLRRLLEQMFERASRLCQILNIKTLGLAVSA